MAEDKNTVLMEGVRIIFRNFQGKEGQYNREGDRNFGVILPDGVAEAMLNDGWNVKYLKPREDDEEETETPWLSVSLNFDKGRPPKDHAGHGSRAYCSGRRLSRDARLGRYHQRRSDRTTLHLGGERPNGYQGIFAVHVRHHRGRRAGTEVRRDGCSVAQMDELIVLFLILLLAIALGIGIILVLSPIA
jgi:hypothetical protein